MHRTLLGFVLLFAAVLGLVAWWASQRLDGIEAEQHGAARVSEAPAPGAELEPAPNVPDPALADAGAREQRTTPPSGAAFEVEVVVRATGLPAPGARVLGFEPGRYETSASGAAILDVWSLVEQDADAQVVRAACDEHGVARLPATAASLQLRAQAPGLLGYGFVRPAAGRRERIELDPLVELSVRVVDAARRPVAGVPVAVAARAGKASGPFDQTLARTGADGLASLRHVVPGKFAATTALGVRLAIPMRDAAVVPVDLARPPREPIELVLPACGSVRARAVRKGGDGSGVACTKWRAASALGAPKSFERHDVPPTECGDDWARWEFVEAGLPLHLDAFAEGFEPAQLESRGPERAGDAVALVVEFARPLPVVRGLLADAERRPLAGAELDVGLTFLTANGGRKTDQRATTDAAGRFGFPLSGFKANTGGLGLELRVRTPAPWTGWAATSELALPLADETDLGVLVAAPQPVLLDGVVVDEAGAGVPNATVNASADLSDPRAKQDALALKLGARTATTDAGGRFVVRGTPWAVGTTVGVWRAPYASVQDLRFDPGARDVRIVLQRAGTIEGELLLGSRLLVDWLRVDCVDAAPRAPDARPYVQGAALGAEGAFQVSDLAPGRYELRVRADFPEPLATVPDVLVEAGQTTRVAPIDLRDALHAIELTVSAPGGAPLPTGTCAYTDGSSPRPQRMAVNGGKALLHPRALPFDLAVGAPGLRTRRVEGVTADLALELEPGPTARLALDPSFALPAGVDLRASVAFVPGTAGLTLYKPGQLEVPGAWSSRPIAHGVAVELALTDPGEHRVSWSVAAPDDAQRVVALDAASVRAIVVRDEHGEQRFVLAPRAEDLARALEELRQPR